MEKLSKLQRNTVFPALEALVPCYDPNPVSVDPTTGTRLQNEAEQRRLDELAQFKPAIPVLLALQQSTIEDSERVCCHE